MKRFSGIVCILFLPSAWIILFVHSRYWLSTSFSNLDERSLETVTDEIPFSPVLQHRTHFDSSKPKRPITILSWTPKFVGQSNWYIEGTRPFRKCGFGPDIQCTYTSNQSLLSESDAVLIRMRTAKNVGNLPKVHLPHQKWIFYETESPLQTWPFMAEMDISELHDIFNLTSTYAQDSDVPTHINPVCQYSRTKRLQMQKENFAATKSKGIVWFVSHCNTTSQREMYVKKLAQHIPVDIFGQCGDLKCGKSRGKKVPFEVLEECDRKYLNGTYKFYLAFENSLCKGYVTEKLIKLFEENLNIIPVVLGHVNYSHIMPRDSYIDIRNFKSPRSLADLLKNIDKDDKLYNSWARRKMSLKCSAPKNTPYECRLCEYLHKYQGQKQTVDVAKFWSIQNQCVDPEIF